MAEAASRHVSWGQALAWRVRRQGIDPTLDVTESEVAGRLCGIQAQVPATAVLAIAVRRSAGTADVATALARRELMRTWSVRGTLHLLTPAQAANQLSLLSAARSWHRGSWQRAYATVSVMESLAELVECALASGPLTRDELIAAISDRLNDAELLGKLRSGWSSALKPLAWQGILCGGPPRDNRITFTRPDLLIPGWKGIPDADAAGPAVLRDYLAAFGPATPAAFDQWLLRGFTPKARLRRWFDEIADETTKVVVDGREAALLRSDLDDLLATEPRPTAVHLLPGFDQYLLGPGTGDPEIVPAEHRAKVSRAGGWISPIVLSGGRVVGTWESIDGDPATTLFRGVDVARVALDGAIERMQTVLSGVRAQQGGLKM